jgi:arylsulfatase A-like enzyme
MMRLLTRILPLVAAALAAAADERPPVAKPNILVIIADDMGWGDLAVNGNQNTRTPYLDRLAGSGARLDRFFVDPVCAPTRAALLTGSYPGRWGVTGVTRGAERMSLRATTLADVLHAAGYATACFGKWHNGSAYPYHPRGRGFDEFLGFCCGHWGDYLDPVLERDGEPVATRGFIADVFTDAALEFATRRREHPFFCWLAFNTPHSPFEVPDADWATVQDRPLNQRHHRPDQEDLTTTRAVIAFNENLDRNVGRLLGGLDHHGLTRDTIVVFLSDNGPNSWRWNAGMRGRKGSVDEGGVRVPCFIAWPARIPAGRVLDFPAAHIDLLPTLCGLAGVDPAAARPLDGLSLAPWLARTDPPAAPQRLVFTHWGRKASVRDLRFRATDTELHDLLTDPGQNHDLAAGQPDQHARLTAALREHLARTAPPDIPGPQPVGHRAFPVTTLLAQDAILEGAGLRFSSIHPNASWVTGWTNTGQSVAWDADVLTTGDYEAELLHTAPAGSVGVQLELVAGGARLPIRIAEACDPPLERKPIRVAGGESGSKPFAALRLGRITLPAGRQRLELRPTSIPAGTVIDLQGVRLRLTSPR